MAPIEIRSFRLGYTLQHPYPWRWTTPIVACIFLLLSGFLAVINVPLSAVDTVQQLTYRPNDTLPSVPLGNLIPSILHNPTTSFSPQVLTVGDVIVLNGSMLNYTIVDAFDGLDANATPVSSFAYYNNPFSDGCDVESMTVNVVREKINNTVTWDTPRVEFSVTVVCEIPTRFHLTWSGVYHLSEAITDAAPDYAPPEDPGDIPAYLAADYHHVLMAWRGPSFPPDQRFFPLPAIGATFSLTTIPCCDCNATLAGAPPETASLLRHPCSSTPAGFILEKGGLSMKTDADTTVFGNITAPMTVVDFLESVEPLLGDTPVPLSGLDALWQNLVESFYHLVRMDLGVIIDNQIYNSPEMYNQTIIGVPSDLGSAANSSRKSTSNATLMAEWQKKVDFLQNSDRVPVMEYLRPVSHREDIRTAPDADFRGTTRPYGSGKPDLEWDDVSEITHLAVEQESNSARQTPLERLRLDMEKMVDDNQKMVDEKLAGIQLFLKRHGLIEGEGNEMAIELERTGPRNANPDGPFGH
ncbi:hypothetical protein B0H14DRAFT_3872679 [Mycena olivaceomarginata]|nr:hypothetical protein B0H14DRAFT_3872679 [Mycena olivaceomarginata]